jgi:hypothetical protein
MGIIWYQENDTENQKEGNGRFDDALEELDILTFWEKTTTT